MLADLSEDSEAARRIAFTLAKMGNKLGLPYPTGADLLLQAAMERPEAVTPDQFRVAYAMRSGGNDQRPIPANPISSIARTPAYQEPPFIRFGMPRARPEL